jgi:hypothetical protein
MTNLPAYLLAIGFIFAVMSLLHHYAETGLRDYALYAMRDPAPRYLVYRGAVLAGGAAPLPLLALAWLYQHRLSRLGFYSVAAAVACSGLWTGCGEFARLASYYPASSLLSILGAADLFAVIGALLPLTLSVMALREGRPPAARAGDVRRAASALHGASDWLPLSTAKRWFKHGGLIIGEACPPTSIPNKRARHPCSATTAMKAPAISWSSPVPAATRPPARWCRRPWNGARDWSASIPRPRLCGWPMRPVGASIIAWSR